MDLGLAGRRAFITGGSHGIGLAIAQALASGGAEMVVCGGRDLGRSVSPAAVVARDGR